MDIFGTLTSVLAPTLTANTLRHCHHGITINTAPMTSITRNMIQEVPTAVYEISSGDITNSVDAGYGIHLWNSFGAEVHENEIVLQGSPTANDDDPINTKGSRGIIVRECTYTDPNRTMRAYITNNIVRGAFGVGTQFIGSNESVQLNCNSYQENPLIDWYLAAGAVLPPQGSCEAITVTQPLTPFVCDWHNDLSLPHIKNLGAKLVFRYATGSKTDNVVEIGNNIVFEEQCNNFIPNCKIEFEELICDQLDDRMLLYLLNSGDKEAARLALECKNDDLSKKVLAGEYLEKTEYTKSDQKLNQLPNSTANGKFKNVVQSMLKLEQGIGSAEQELQKLQAWASGNHSYATALAEAALVQYGTAKYVRYVEKTASTAGKSNTNTDATDTAAPAQYHIVPNPADDVVYIEWNGKEATNLTIYDMNKKPMMKVRLETGNNPVSIRALPIGIYLLQIEGINHVNKLSIVR
ncbi:MAG: T9SS type A sorting domain-containing protein [Sphingobacteriales bacterium]|nr:T9SS type A sorting domain-containing protein [Sphingobacteriales bacterium]